MATRSFTVPVLLWFAFLPNAAMGETPQYDNRWMPVGVAKVDITPDYPIRLSGYGHRYTESEGVSQRIWAKALAIGTDTGGPAILITVDNCGVPAAVTNEVAARLKRNRGIPRERVAVCSSHTHSAPMLTGVLPLLFAQPIPADQQKRITRYTAELTNYLEQVALAALAARKPSRLDWAVGKVTFAINRRPQGGPVDHSLPLLRVTDPNGKLRAVLVRYACHNVTLVPPFNKFNGDWAGYAQVGIERDHPGAIAMVSIGCSGDSKPKPKKLFKHARQHGEEVTREVNRLLKGSLKPVREPLTARLETIELPFDRLPTKQEWIERSKSRHKATAYHARVQLDRLKRGEKLVTKISYPVQVWTFGHDLAMVFLAGEVVGDYTVRLNREFDRTRLWINAYSNDVSCYIASEKVLKEGGYEADRSMLYYDRPTRFAAGIEDKIVNTVTRLLPHEFYSSQKQRELPPPKSPAEATSSLRTKPGLKVELAAAEPLVVDPVAIDFGSDGRLWVVEYRDYPTGIDRQGRPGGRITYLEDTDHDGRFDKSTLFLDHVPFPTGVMEWRRGVLIATAPDILYAEDTDGDGRADVRRVLFHGFDTTNFQARVNGFRYGLDNWVHGSGGLYGGTITRGKQSVRLRSRDFRFHPDTGEIEAMTGRSQYGRIHDDWGNWFGNRNSSRFLHFPFPGRYLKRNRYTTPPPIEVYVPTGGENANRLYPASRTLMRFNNPLDFNRVTSACGPTIYRDDLLGSEYAGDAFVCQPVHNLVTRLKLSAEGVTFTGHRVPDEQHTEFLASTDNWFRPVQARTGPDGALWIVDMYRFVIEHPKWIGPDRLEMLNVRAGDDKGRIYRIVPKERAVRPLVNLRKLSTEQLAAAMESPHGTLRDLVQRKLVERNDRTAIGPLEQLVQKSRLPAVRLQALWTLRGLNALKPLLIEQTLADAHPQVRRGAVRLSEPLLASHPDLAAAVLKRVDDPQITVRYQLALSLGEWDDSRAGRVLVQLAQKEGADKYVSAAILSSALPHLKVLVTGLLDGKNAARRSAVLLPALVRMAVAVRNEAAVTQIIRRAILPRENGNVSTSSFKVLATLLEGLEKRKQTLGRFHRQAGPELKTAIENLSTVFSAARQAVVDDKAPRQRRLAAMALLGRGRSRQDDDRKLLGRLTATEQPIAVQLAAVSALGQLRDQQIPAMLLSGWRGRGPQMRSAILDVLLRRPQWTRTLFDAIEEGHIRAAEIGTSRRNLLSAHTNPNIRQRARKLLATTASADRQKVLATYRTALSLTGQAERGHKLFAKVCENCHHFRGSGKKVGPDLDTITNRSPQALLISLLDPNRAVESKYLSYAAVTSDGRLFTGRLVDETSTSIHLLGSKGESHLLLRTDLEQLVGSGKSLMPEGLEKDLRPQDVADVIAYLRTAGPARKVFPGNQPEVIRADSGGNFKCLPARAEIYGPTLSQGRHQRVVVLMNWKSRDDRAVWRLDVKRSGEYEVWLDRLCDPGTAGNRFALSTGSAGKPVLTIKTRDTTARENWFRARRLGRITLHVGPQQISLGASGSISGSLFHLRSLTLIPVRDQK